jgi:hypothetical protein
MQSLNGFPGSPSLALRLLTLFLQFGDEAVDRAACRCVRRTLCRLSQFAGTIGKYNVCLKYSTGIAV